MVRPGFNSSRGWRIPSGWTRTASGVYEHPDFGKIQRFEGPRQVTAWLAFPKNGLRQRGTLLNLRTAALECERLMMEP